VVSEGVARLSLSTSLFAHGERLLTHQFTVERRMLREVPDDHVAAAARQPGPPHVVGGELVGQAVVEPAQFVERLEHFAVAGGVGVPAGDDVAAVGAVVADGADELVAVGERVAERVAQLVGLRSGEYEFRVARGDRDSVRPGGDCRATAREFLDQPRCRGFLYPPRGRESASTCVPFLTDGRIKAVRRADEAVRRSQSASGDDRPTILINLISVIYCNGL